MKIVERRYPPYYCSISPENELFGSQAGHSSKVARCLVQRHCGRRRPFSMVVAR